MCTTCGCDVVHDDHEHDHEGQGLHDHHRVEAERGDPAATQRSRRVASVEIDVLAKSKRFAARNRAWCSENGVTLVNMMSAPGAGKTTLLERVVRGLSSHRAVFVIEGDQATSLDADRIRAAGARAVQVNTGTGCHLDPHMIAHALNDLAPPRNSCVIIENVGNLVCPALFDLGEHARVVLLSTPEGDDKPLKYPHMFASASMVLLTKSDLLPYVPFDLVRCRIALAKVCPKARVLPISSTNGDGLEVFLDWLVSVVANTRLAVELSR